MDDVIQEANRLLTAQTPFVLATVVGTKGSTPQKPGAKLLVRDDGTIAGTLGGGCVEADVWAEARRILKEGGAPSVESFTLTDELAAESGLVCGGTMRILIDPVNGEPFFAEMTQAIAVAEAGGDAVGVATITRDP